MKNNEQTEQQYVDKVTTQLKKYFTVIHEVWSDCKNGRIDLIITTLEGQSFGIECKRPEFSKEWIENMRKSQLGKKHSLEHKKKHREGLLNYWKKRKENEQNNCI